MTSSAQHDPAPAPRYVPVWSPDPEVVTLASTLGIARSSAYDMVARGLVPTIRIGAASSTKPTIRVALHRLDAMVEYPVKADPLTGRQGEPGQPGASDDADEPGRVTGRVTDEPPEA